MRSTALSMAPRNPRRAPKSSASTHPSTRPDPSTHPSTQARHRPRGSRCSPWGGSSPSLGRCSRSTSRASRSTSTPRGARAAPLRPAPAPQPRHPLVRAHACSHACCPLEHSSRAQLSPLGVGSDSEGWHLLLEGGCDATQSGQEGVPYTSTPQRALRGSDPLPHTLPLYCWFLVGAVFDFLAEKRDVCAHLFFQRVSRIVSPSN